MVISLLIGIIVITITISVINAVLIAIVLIRIIPTVAGIICLAEPSVVIVAITIGRLQWQYRIWIDGHSIAKIAAWNTNVAIILFICSF